MAAFPALRNVEPIPVEREGETVICLHDPMGYVEAQLALSPAAYFVAICLDGQRDATAVQREFARQFRGARIAEQQILEIVQFLDQHGFLLSDRFDALRNATEDAFRAEPVRRMRLAGETYPKGVKALAKMLDALFTQDGGPGKRPEPAGVEIPPLRCLVAPHIDFQRGGHVYAHGYHRLCQGGRPDTVIIFGVAHQAGPVPFILTRKDFETPFGLLKTDTDAVARLEQASHWNPYAYEFLHRNEHSIEFQALLLAHLYGTGVKIVPILCAMFSDDPAMSRPQEIAPVQRFLTVCRELAAPPKNRMTVIAAADLAHVGAHFGDDFEINDTVVCAVAARDQEDLNYILAGDPEAFYASVMKDLNARKVCGLNCIYSALKTVQGSVSGGELLRYDYAPDPVGGIVSFASIALS